MKIHVENQVLEYENKIENIDVILQEIDRIVSNNSKILIHMVMDGSEVYEDFYDYFLDNIRLIKEVKIISLTYMELVDDIMTSTLNYIESSLHLIEELSKDFYKDPDQDAWNDLNDLLGSLSWIINTFTMIDQDKRLQDIVYDYKDWNLYAKQIFLLKDILIDFKRALENGDNITIADILQYEILSIFAEVQKILLKSVDTGVNLNDLN